MGQISDQKVLITGAGGFVGTRLCEFASGAGLSVRRAIRHADGKDGAFIGEIGPETDWTEALAGIKTIIHMAARVHVMGDKADNPLFEYRRVNVLGTINLARQAADAGVQRFIFISSVKVNGEVTLPGRPFTALDKASPQGPYAISKYEAERELLRIAHRSDLQVVIIRPPLVYGPGVRANFARMIKAVQTGIPLPLRAVRNNRSLVSIENLIDLIITCIDHPAAAGSTLMVSDGEDLSTPDIIRKLAKAMDRPARLFPISPILLELCGCLAGKRAEVDRLIGSLQVDISHTCETLGWRPPVSVDSALRDTVRHLSKCNS